MICLSTDLRLTVPDPYPASLEPPFDRSALPSGSRPVLLGLVLLHPNLVGPMGPTLSRLLSRSTFGRSILRPLLRSEVGEVANRRAWHHAERLTPEVCATLYHSHAPCAGMTYHYFSLDNIS